MSALNHTAPVNANGAWLLANVPADLGPLRVRATCVAPDGTVTSGASYAFVASGPAGLYVVDVTALAAPQVVANLALPGNANDVRVAS